jgi:hypothetical protein
LHVILQITSHERYLHIGAADGAPGFEELVQEISGHFGVPGTSAVLQDMTDHNGDWDVLYPFSSVRPCLQPTNQTDVFLVHVSL